MGDIREFGQSLGKLAKKRHAERITKTPQRISYAEKLFILHGLTYELKNANTGHFQVWRKADGKLFQFWAGTGKILGYEHRRGIHDFIKLVTKKPAGATNTNEPTDG